MKKRDRIAKKRAKRFYHDWRKHGRRNATRALPRLTHVVTGCSLEICEGVTITDEMLAIIESRVRAAETSRRIIEEGWKKFPISK